jgi:hypothetical protein
VRLGAGGEQQDGQVGILRARPFGQLEAGHRAGEGTLGQEQPDVVVADDRQRLVSRARGDEPIFPTQLPAQQLERRDVAVDG